MATFGHARSPSSETSSSDGSQTHQLILEHIMSYPGTYELPLRTMYTLNCMPRAQPLPHFTRKGSGSSTASNSPTAASFGSAGDHTSQQFTSSLMAEIAQMPSQPTSLPPSFITSFARKCFAMDLRMIDFPQALTSLDYLRDLESRRRREVATALDRLEIRRETLGTAEDDLSHRFPGVLSWFKSVELKERKIEALYTQIYIGIRRWILINEMSLRPFNKNNCIAMLNTLYPPAISTPPTSKLTPTILKQQRDSFFKYILAVEKTSPRVLKTLMDQGKKEQDATGWPNVRRMLDQYLDLANSIIAECDDIVIADDAAKHSSSIGKRNGRKVDSGISMKSAESRSSSGLNSNASDNSDSYKVRQQVPIVRGGTTLEKIARELKSMGRSRVDITEISCAEQVSHSEFKDSTKGLRRLRSIGSLGNLRKANSSSLSVAGHKSTGDAPDFDIDEMKRQRMIYEANAAKTMRPMAATPLGA